MIAVNSKEEKMYSDEICMVPLDFVRWLESERDQLQAEQESTELLIAKLLGNIAELEKERDRFKVERDQAKAALDFRHGIGRF